MPTTLSDPSESVLLLTRAVAAKLLSLSQRTLWSRTFPRGPIPCVNIPGTRAIRYRLAALKDFIEANERGGKS
jgi:hypothetical protein